MKYSKWIALSMTLIASFFGHATSISPSDFSSQTISDDYIGAGYGSDVLGSQYKFDVDKMTVERTGTTMTVDIFTSFWNNINDGGIKLGDLFMATSNGHQNPWQPAGQANHSNDRFSDSHNHNTGTNWNYVYDLGGDRKHSSGTGSLKSNFSRTDVYTSTDLVRSGQRRDQAVILRDKSNHVVHDTSSWSIGNSQYHIQGISYRNLRLSFDVAGTALASANQIAFRWAMTCANDIIEGLVKVQKPKVEVSEPQSALIMLVGLLSLLVVRKRFQK